MAWGFQSWDASGKPNNYGIVPITIVGRLLLNFEQLTASQTFTVPDGYVLDYIQCPRSISYTTKRRVISVSGGTVTVRQGGDTSFGIGTESAQAATIVVYLRRA
ncbi:hypothetical protein [Trabulsiella odontotermitis]|uniref:hypothetical protein n=1 Tax=Trabulsiella odontotermitis TaxID=379893 RepID=UPI0006BA136E|nr:hypothetical protein [Trabulsiella odontotermitis]